MSEAKTARTYNQNHTPRKYAKGRRRVSVYIAWSYPGEANRDPTRARQPLLDDDRGAARALARLRGAAMGGPAAVPAGDRRLARAVLLGVGEVPGARRGGHRARRSRCSSASTRRASRCRSTSASSPTPTRCSSSVSTTWSPSRWPRPRRSRPFAQFLEREGTCLVLGPHHDVGHSPDLEERDMEYLHHGDALVPRQQRFGGYTRSLMKGLGIPVENRWGLRPRASSRRRTTESHRAADRRARPRQARLARRASATSTSTCTCRTTR